MTDDTLWAMTDPLHPFPVRLQLTQILVKLREKRTAREVLGVDTWDDQLVFQIAAEVFGEYLLTLFMLGHNVAVEPPEIFDFSLMQSIVKQKYESNVTIGGELPAMQPSKKYPASGKD